MPCIEKAQHAARIHPVLPHLLLLFELHWTVVTVNWKWEGEAETTSVPVF